MAGPIDDLLSNRAWHVVHDARRPYLNAEGLIRLKEASDREKDRIEGA